MRDQRRSWYVNLFIPSFQRCEVGAKRYVWDLWSFDFCDQISE